MNYFKAGVIFLLAFGQRTYSVQPPEAFGTSAKQKTAKSEFGTKGINQQLGRAFIVETQKILARISDINNQKQKLEESAFTLSVNDYTQQKKYLESLKTQLLRDSEQLLQIYDLLKEWKEYKSFQDKIRSI